MSLESTSVKTGFIFAIASAALFAIRPIFVKLVYSLGVDSTTLIGLRMLFSVPIYIILLAYFLRDSKLRAKLKRKDILAISGAGLLGYYAASFLDLLGLQYVTAQLGRMLLYTYPTFVVLLGALFFGKPISIRTTAALALTYCGIAIIFGHDLSTFGEDVVTGAIYITGSAITFSLYLLLSKPLMQDVGSRVFTCIAFIAAGIGIGIHYLITHSSDLTPVDSHALLLIMCIAIFCTVIPSFFTAAAVLHIGPDRTGIVAMVGPGFTSLFAILILNEVFTIYHFAGIVLTIAGVATLSRK